MGTDTNFKTAQYWKNNLPDDFNKAVETARSLKDNPVALQEFINGLLINIQGKADQNDNSGAGKIGEDSEDTYRLIKNTPKNTPIKELKCGQGHQPIVDILNKAGMEANLIGVKTLDSPLRTGHVNLLVSPKKGVYIVSDWGLESHIFNASDTLEATKKAQLIMEHNNNSLYHIYSKDGNHLQYKERAIGDLVRADQNYDKNSSNALNAPNRLALDTPSMLNSKAGFKPSISYSEKSGNDPYFGNYSTKVAELNLKGDIDLGKGYEARINQTTQAALIKSDINVKVDDNHLNKKLEIMPITPRIEAMVLTPNLTGDPKTQVKGFIYSDATGYLMNSKGSVTKNGEHIGNSKYFVDDEYIGLYLGAAASKETPHTKTSASIYAGERIDKDTGIYDQNILKFQRENVAGAEVRFGSKSNLTKDVNLTTATSVSGAYVNAPFYNRSMLAAQTNISLENDVSRIYGYGGTSLSNTSFAGLESEHREFKPYGGVGFDVHTKNKKLRLGGDYQITPNGQGAMVKLGASF
jgi:hypothetical protein